MKRGKLIAAGVLESDPDVWGELGREAWAAFVAEQRREGPVRDGRRTSMAQSSRFAISPLASSRGIGREKKGPSGSSTNNVKAPAESCPSVQPDAHREAAGVVTVVVVVDEQE